MINLVLITSKVDIILGFVEKVLIDGRVTSAKIENGNKKKPVKIFLILIASIKYIFTFFYIEMLLLIKK